MKTKGNFFRSLRFRILVILIILGIVPGIVVTKMVINNYAGRAVSVRTQDVMNQCDILCSLLIKENYLNDPGSQAANSKLELFSNVYNGRVLIVDRDFKVIKDTYQAEEGKTLVKESGQAITIKKQKCWRLQFRLRVRMSHSFRVLCW